MVYNKIINNYGKRKLFALLIDPDKHDKSSLKETINKANNAGVDIILIGGSLVSIPIEETINDIKSQSNIPCVLFPGSLLQLSNNADAILLLSLISGRNPDLLIGNHVIAAPILKRSNVEVISTGYMLIENGKTTSVEYMSNTTPIPKDKIDIAVATAIAGEMIGNKMIYLEAGSGAKNHIQADMIKAIKSQINIPLIVGGGIKTPEDIETVCNAGADIIVIGTAIEKDPEILSKLVNKAHN